MFWLLASRDCQWPRSVLRKTSLGRNDSYNQITDSESGSITDDEDDKPGGVPLPEGIRMDDNSCEQLSDSEESDHSDT